MTFKNWLAGLVMGVCGGFLVLLFPIMGVLLIGLGVIGILRARPRLAGASGLLLGIGAIILTLLARAQNRVARRSMLPRTRAARHRPSRPTLFSRVG